MSEANRKAIAQQFARRLTSLLKKRGYGSHTAAAGVKTKMLAEQLDCSVQIARRYTLGESLPEPEQLIKIAKWLGVSSGWLLFGESDQATPALISMAELDPELIKYILKRVNVLHDQGIDLNELVEFTYDLIYDALHLRTNKKTVYKMIDMSIQSVQRFNKKKRRIA